jgi:hypothetical protein
MDHITFMESFAVGSDRSVDQQSFTTPGTTTFQIPANVYSLSWLGIQGGQGGASAGGDGGYLAYLDNIAVTPLETLTIVIGAGGISAASTTSASLKGAVGGHSSLTRSGTVLATTDPAVSIPGIVRFAGGIGGDAFISQTSDGGGGGGAGGYAGAGGRGASYAGSDTVALAAGGTGGSSGGGGMTRGYFEASTLWVGFFGGRGGGTGLLGQSSSGAAGTSLTANVMRGAADDVNSGGGIGSPSGGVGYGGGGGGGRGTVDTTNGNQTRTPGQNGTGGAVQLIWPGTVRQYPSTRTADE